MMRREGWVGLEKVRDRDGDGGWEMGGGRWGVVVLDVVARCVQRTE